MNRIMAVLMFLMICFTQGRADTLPKPTGEYHVGVTYLSFIDETRTELFDNNQEKKREITVKAWYPSDSETEKEPYLLSTELAFATKYLGFPETYRNLKTNSSLDVPISSKEEQYPILIFSHGFGEHYSQNSILMEELASHGYIVFSVSHHYECKFSSYPDGRLLYIDLENQRLQKIMTEQRNPKAMTLLQQTIAAKDDEERMDVLLEVSNTIPTMINESSVYWAEDLAFLIDQFDEISDSNMIFKDKMDIDRIGIFGMSLGGLATTRICMTDSRIKAGVSLDGGLYGDLIERELEIPFMYLSGKRFHGYGKIFTDRSQKDCYALSIKGAAHYNFSDYSVYPVPSIGFLLGTIDGKLTIEIMNILALAFFDKYLNDGEKIDLIELAKKYPEIEIVANFGEQ